MTAFKLGGSRPLAMLQRKLGSRALELFFNGLTTAGRLHPLARLERHGVERLADIAYADSDLPEQRLDVYRPIERPDHPLPVCLYIHGGGFRILSKDSHWLMGLLFARRGYVVFNISYRLAPRHQRSERSTPDGRSPQRCSPAPARVAARNAHPEGAPDPAAPRP